MKKIAEHAILLSGESYESCCEQVRAYFKTTSLVLYHVVEIRKDRSCPATDFPFSATLERVQDKNRKRIKDLINDLKNPVLQQLTI